VKKREKTEKNEKKHPLKSHFFPPVALSCTFLSKILTLHARCAFGTLFYPFWHRKHELPRENNCGFFLLWQRRLNGQQRLDDLVHLFNIMYANDLRIGQGAPGDSGGGAH